MSPYDAMQREALSGAKGARFAMSVDVEDFFQVWAFSDVIEPKSWGGYESRVEAATRRCMDLFDAVGAKATFFTLGWVAERRPELIREIVLRGHELASHGYDHTKIHAQSEAEFRQDVVKAKAILEDIAGVRIAGYRAPGFSLDGTTPWAHGVLAETGHLYSSSTHPISHDHYGDRDAPRTPYHCDGILEAPVATATAFDRRFSCAGGGWFRLLPLAVFEALFERAARQIDGPLVFYFHPWEVDPDQPRIQNASLKSKLRHYTNLKRMERKLSRFIRGKQFHRVIDTLEPFGISVGS